MFRLTGLSALSAGLFRRGIPSGVEDLDLDRLERDLEDLKNKTKFRSSSHWWEDIFGIGGYKKQIKTRSDKFRLMKLEQVGTILGVKDLALDLEDPKKTIYSICEFFSSAASIQLRFLFK